MNFALIVPAVLTTGGILTTSTVVSVNYSVKDSDPKTSLSTEISAKNIEAITNISKLQTANKIVDLDRESIANITNPQSTTLSTNYDSKIYVNEVVEKSNIEIATSSISRQYKDLGDLLKEKIRLDKEKTTYEKVKKHFEDKPIQKSEWQITEDKSIPSGCKLDKLPTTPVVPGASSAKTCYDWQIILMDPKEKIKQLLVGETSLLAEFNKITTS